MRSESPYRKTIIASGTMTRLSSTCRAADRYSTHSLPVFRGIEPFTPSYAQLQFTIFATSFDSKILRHQLSRAINHPRATQTMFLDGVAQATLSRRKLFCSETRQNREYNPLEVIRTMTTWIPFALRKSNSRLFASTCLTVAVRNSIIYRSRNNILLEALRTSSSLIQCCI